LIVQKKGLADAEWGLEPKVTKKARGDARVTDARRTEPKNDDRRIVPMTYAPILITMDGRL